MREYQPRIDGRFFVAIGLPPAIFVLGLSIAISAAAHSAGPLAAGAGLTLLIVFGLPLLSYSQTAYRVGAESLSVVCGFIGKELVIRYADIARIDKNGSPLGGTIGWQPALTAFSFDNVVVRYRRDGLEHRVTISPRDTAAFLAELEAVRHA